VAKAARGRVTSPAADFAMAKPMLIGYACVSTVDQNLGLQRDAFTEAGCQRFFTEQMSGAVTDRPALRYATAQPAPPASGRRALAQPSGGGTQAGRLLLSCPSRNRGNFI